MNTLILTAALMVAPDAGPLLVEDGQPRCSIVIPNETTKTVRVAAEELAAYIERISGAAPPIVSESQAPAGTRIDVGLTRKARTQLPERFTDHPERVLVRSDAGGVLVAGGGERGTLFAAYRFLELLGCRWLGPGEENELIPRRPTLKAPPTELDTQPAFEWRLFNAGDDPRHRSWGVKMGMNGLYSAESAAGNGGCLYWPAAVPGVHAYRDIMPSAKYFEAHPQWYPLVGGQRVPSQSHNRQLCVTAEGLAEEFAANVIRVFDADPACRMMSISPNDGYGWCECAACTELDRKLCGGRTTRQGLARERPFRGDRVFWFANQVAGHVAKKYPDRKLLVLAYVNYAEPPDSVRPLPSVVPFLCHYAPADYSRAINDPASEPNRQFNALLTGWVEKTPEVLIYSYVSKSMWWRLPRPVLRPFAADIKYYHKLGIRRYYCQSRLSDWELDGPLYYVIARLLWDPSADPAAIAQDWIRGMFGPAAGQMAEYYEAVDAAVRKTGKPFSDNPPRDVPGLFDRQSLDRAMAALERAEALGADDCVKRRIGKVANWFRYGYHMTRAIELQEQFLESYDPDTLEEARAAGRKALGYCKVRESARLLDSWHVVTQMGVLAKGFGQEETKGGRRCWNSDETGPGDGSNGWATFGVRAADPSETLVLEMDVWGMSQLGRIVVNTREGVWTPVPPEKPLSGKPNWDTLVYHIKPEVMNQTRSAQTIGFGGGDSQVWVAEIRTPKR